MKYLKNETKPNNTLLVTLIVAVVAGGFGFFGGMKYQQSQVKQFTFQNGNGGMPNGTGAMRIGRGGNTATRPVTGEIINNDDTSITVKMDDGSSKIVLINGSTSINKAEEVTKSELTAGTNVAVFGTTNSDGSVTALNVQVNPQARVFGGPAGEGAPAATPAQ